MNWRDLIGESIPGQDGGEIQMGPDQSVPITEDKDGNAKKKKPVKLSIKKHLQRWW